MSTLLNKFGKFLSIRASNRGERGVKKGQEYVNVVCERPHTLVIKKTYLS